MYFITSLIRPPHYSDHVPNIANMTSLIRPPNYSDQVPNIAKVYFITSAILLCTVEPQLSEPHGAGGGPYVLKSASLKLCIKLLNLAQRTFSFI